MKDKSNKLDRMFEKEKSTVYDAYQVDDAIKMRLDKTFDATYGSKSEINKSSFLFPIFAGVFQYLNQLFGVKAGLSIASVVLLASLYFQVNTSNNNQGISNVVIADSAQVSDTANTTPLDSVHSPL